jgi:thiol-disulfide isomerase/thioredoxin
MSFYEKYLKYKSKYLNLKYNITQSAGADSDNASVASDESEATKAKLLVTPYTKPDFKWDATKESDKWSYFQNSSRQHIANDLIKELEHRMSKQRRITQEQAKVYIRALESQYYNHARKCISAKKECTSEAQISILAKRFVTYINNKELVRTNAINLYKHLYEGVNFHKQSGGSSESEKSLTHLSSTPSTPKGVSRSQSPSSPKSPKVENLLVNSHERGWAKNKQVGGGEKKEIYLFKAEWCPHCVGFKPTWAKLEKEFNSKYSFITYDSEKNKDSIKKWDIKGFPTIIKRTGNDMEEYVGPRDEESVRNFITAD